ncbi:glycosyltransferase family 4 protein [Crocinitomix catalasitica]|uniref:glycosyltransferase family 4 protein n=1 Tax=Crocinitomix catalasitica TaxID=184607 RepID=UPI000481DE4B|nr:glycosyltransferase family 4 protein [Crocinitomix catalasitica]
MKQKLNILFLTSWYPNLEDEAHGNFIQQHANAVAEYCNVHVLNVVAREQEASLDVQHNVVSDSLTETIVYCKKLNGTLYKVLPLLRFKSKQHGFKVGFEVIQEKYGRIDLTHLNVFYPAGYFALKLKKKFKTPFIYTEHWTIFLPSSKVQPNALEKLLMRKIVEKATFVCPVSEGLANELQIYGHGEKFRIVPNVIDTELFYPVESPKVNQPIKLIHISGMNDYQKNISGLLKMVQYLKIAGLDFEISLIGELLNDAQLEMIRSYDIADKVNNVQNLKPNEVADYLRASDLFVLTSHYETFSIVIAEALACGIPVITTNVDGVAQKLTEEDGFVVDLGDMKGMAAQIVSMIEHLPTYKKNIKAKNYGEIYSKSAVGKQYTELYFKALKIN